MSLDKKFPNSLILWDIPWTSETWNATAIISWPRVSLVTSIRRISFIPKAKTKFHKATITEGRRCMNLKEKKLSHTLISTNFTNSVRTVSNKKSEKLTKNVRNTQSPNKCPRRTLKAIRTSHNRRPKTTSQKKTTSNTTRPKSKRHSTTVTHIKQAMYCRRNTTPSPRRTRVLICLPKVQRKSLKSKMSRTLSLPWRPIALKKNNPLKKSPLMIFMWGRVLAKEGSALHTWLFTRLRVQFLR